MPLVSARSAPLFAFANDGSVAWLRESGSRLVAVDTTSGEILREVRLDPAPFGIGWRVERQASFFVVRDDRAIAAYDDATGMRLWQRTWPTHVAFAGERDGRHISVVPGPEGVGVALADLATGAFDAKLQVEGTMRFIGAHGTLADDLLFFATDERDVFAIDLRSWRVAHRHRMHGSHVLPPVATSSGVHVASVERGDAGAVTHVATLDRVTGFLVSSLTFPGTAHLLAAGTNGLILETRRSPNGAVERIAFRPESPSVRLRVGKHVDMRLLQNDAPTSLLLGTGEGADPNAAERPDVHDALILGNRRVEGRRDEMIPAPRDWSEKLPVAGREGLRGLLALLEARSDVLLRLVDAFEGGNAAVIRLQRLGITLRDPRARWTACAGRDPCLLDLAENRDGDAIATYFYPRGATGCVPVVLVSRATGEARWLADDFDVWFAGVLHNAAAYAPDAVRIMVEELALARDFPRPLAHATPPPWFFEAHATSWTLADADAALAAGDIEGSERMLVAVGRDNGAGVKERLATVYTMLGWDHHRATVVETW